MMGKRKFSGAVKMVPFFLVSLQYAVNGITLTGVY